MTTLLVYPNPWAAFDKDGTPCGICPRDPEWDGGGPLQFVGARIDKSKTRVTQVLQRGDDIRSPMQRTAYEYMGISSSDPDLRQKLFALEPIEIPNTRYYRDRLRDRALLPADKVQAERDQAAAQAELQAKVAAKAEHVAARASTSSKSS